MNAPLTPWQATQARNADAQIKADAIEQREVAALEGLYADKLPKQEPTLRQLAERALVANHTLLGATPAEWAAADVEYWLAVNALHVALVDQTGIPTALWRQLGSILP